MSIGGHSTVYSAKLWNQHRCLSPEEKIKEIVTHVHIGIVFSHKEQNYILSEWNKTHKNKYISPTCRS